MLKIGITGGIGSGKSVVTALFAKLGVPVFDSDRAARELIDNDPVIRSQITAAFGPAAYLPGHQGLDRKKIGQLVFKDQDLLETLNKITHPPVIKAAENWVAAQNKVFEAKMNKWASMVPAAESSHRFTPPKPVGYLIKEAALLFESGTHRTLDFILGVYADKATRIQRILDRDKLSREAAENRMQKQMEEHHKMKLCDGVIINDGQRLLWPQIIAWHSYFLQLADKKANRV